MVPSAAFAQEFQEHLDHLKRDDFRVFDQVDTAIDQPDLGISVLVPHERLEMLSCRAQNGSRVSLTLS